MRTRWAYAVFGLGIALVAVIWRAERSRTDPARCPVGHYAVSGRCCLEGQKLSGRYCVGNVSRCPEPLLQATAGCVPPADKIEISEGEFTVARNDWQSAQGDEVVRSSGFVMDRTEVTASAWASCVAAKACAQNAAIAKDAEAEPTLPAAGVSYEQAQAFCRSKGGRVPTRQEWIFAASGGANRRYPWGQTGLVCRRSVFGLVRGPCATSVGGPESVGSRPAGATPSGLLDMSGNLAEWAIAPNGPMLMGGSYRSELASELKVWSTERPAQDISHAGFRCVYPKPNTTAPTPKLPLDP